MDNSNLMVVKREIVSTTNTHGWNYIQKLAEKSVEKMEREAIDEEDDIKGSAKRREAKAARKFLNEFLTQVNLARQVSDDTNDDDFLEICM